MELELADKDTKCPFVVEALPIKKNTPEKKPICQFFLSI